MTDLSQLEVFVRVVDTGSFTAAAERLGVSKSYASRQLSALEDRLGARLLNRTTRKLMLTDVGRVFHERCTHILAELTEAEATVSELQTRPRGLLRLSVPMSFGVRYIAPMVAEFMARYPDLEVDMSLTDRRVDLLEDHHDLAIRIGKLDDSSLIARRLAANSMLVCAAPAYLREHGEPREPAELRRHSCLLYAYQSAGQQSWHLSGPGGDTSVHVRGRMLCNNGDAIVAAARRGLGFAFLPEFMAGDDLRGGRLVRVLPAWHAAGPVFAVYPHSRHLSAKVRLFVDELAERFADPPWAGCSDASPRSGRAAKSGERSTGP